MIDKLFYSAFGYLDLWSKWVEKHFIKKNKNERHKNNRKISKS
jgi:hypothetical protein